MGVIKADIIESCLIFMKYLSTLKFVFGSEPLHNPNPRQVQHGAVEAANSVREL